MMNQAYFVGKNILIDWINNFLEINIDKVEQCANGAIYCNLWDAIHPGTIPMSRVDFTVKHEYEFTKNWKLLQNGFQKAGIDKLIPVQRLVKARYQDNLEFLQWMYKYARDTYNGDPDDPSYDAIGRRSKSKGGKDYTGSLKPRGNSHRNVNRNNRTSARPTSASNKHQGSNAAPYKSGTQSQRGSVLATQPQTQMNSQQLEELQDENKRLAESRDTLQLKLNALQTEHEELSTVAKDIEVERDFYFNKVCAIEQILKDEADQNSELLKAIYEVLYQTEEDAKNANKNDEQNVHQDMNNMQMG